MWHPDETGENMTALSIHLHVLVNRYEEVTSKDSIGKQLQLSPMYLSTPKPYCKFDHTNLVFLLESKC